jgi:NhaP-type Na+/H+ or K+/H+ antiporter
MMTAALFPAGLVCFIFALAWFEHAAREDDHLIAFISNCIGSFALLAIVGLIYSSIKYHLIVAPLNQ